MGIHPGATDLAVEVAAIRERISRFGDSPANYDHKRQLLADARGLTSRASLLADLASGAALASVTRKRGEYDPNMIAANLARLATRGQTTHGIASPTRPKSGSTSTTFQAASAAGLCTGLWSFPKSS